MESENIKKPQLDEIPHSLALHRYMKANKINHRDLMQLIVYRCRRVKSETVENEDGEKTTITTVTYDGECFESSESMSVELAEHVSNIRTYKAYLEKKGLIVSAGHQHTKQRAIKKYVLSENIIEILTCSKSTAPLNLTCSKSTAQTCSKSTAQTCSKSTAQKVYINNNRKEEGSKLPSTTCLFTFDDWKSAYDSQPHPFKFADDTLESTYQKVKEAGFKDKNGKQVEDLQKYLSHWVDHERVKQEQQQTPPQKNNFIILCNGTKVECE